MTAVSQHHTPILHVASVPKNTFLLPQFEEVWTVGDYNEQI